jgi:hypothetical protein
MATAMRQATRRALQSRESPHPHRARQAARADAEVAGAESRLHGPSRPRPEGSGMNRVPRLNWPADLYKDIGCARTYVAAAGEPVPKIGRVADATLCACGCKLRHNYAVSRVVEEHRYGMPTRSVVWYRSLDCRNKHMGFVRRST